MQVEKHRVSRGHDGFRAEKRKHVNYNMADKNQRNSVNCVLCGKNDEIMKRCGRCKSIFYWYLPPIFLIWKYTIGFLLFNFAR